jgi:GrpB-like predicted nucleotidyltransferase (UPF0157 family)
MITQGGAADPERANLGTVRLSEASQTWPILFEVERDRLASAVGGAFGNIMHFGSTAVPNLRAKPIIDIMASIDELSLVDAIAPALRRLGYEPAEVGFLKRRFLRKAPPSDGVAYHLHIVRTAAWPNKNELLLRDWLIANPDVAAAYETLKETLAREHPDDMPAYTAGKTDFLRRAVNDARQAKGLLPETDWVE